MRYLISCICGTEFETTASRLATGRGRFCSRECSYANRTRSSGLTYNLVRDNPTSFRPGRAPWNKGVKGLPEPRNAVRPGEHLSPDTEFSPVEVSGEKNWRWGGGPGSRCRDRPGYAAIHSRVHRERGAASDQQCAFADTTCKRPMQWACISQEYRGVDDFMPLCTSHHVRYDGALL